MSDQLPEPRHVGRRADKANGERPGRRWLARGGSLVYPGLGQILAGRFLPGAIYVVIATIGLILLGVPLLNWVFDYFAAVQALLEGEEMGDAAQRPNWRMMVSGLALIIVAYVISLLDPGGKPPHRPDDAPQSKE